MAEKKEKGRWVAGTVIAVTEDEILLKNGSGNIERIKKSDMSQVVENPKMRAYIQLPGGSRHEGKEYGGTCIEK